MGHDPARDVEIGDAIVVTPRGELSADRVMEICRHIVAHPDFESGMPSLWDLRACDMSPLSRKDLEQIQRFLDGLSSRRGSARIALVADSDLRFGISRMFEAHGTPGYLDFRVFRDLSAGLAWFSEDPQPN